MAGVERTITIASIKDKAALKGLGATDVIDRHVSTSEDNAEVERIVGQDGVTYIYDCISSDYTMPFSLL